ncbi:MAG: Crp/Fnr family transcriptional regulator [Parvularculaceae bacterium]|nr:Crp/Fnr family transcriptional regulator [Parvularculaceae bacterium]
MKKLRGMQAEMPEGSSESYSVSDALEGERWFAGLEPALRETILKGGFIKRFKRGQYLFRQGDKVSGLFGMLAGQAHSQAENSDGKSIVLAVYHAPDWVGFLACADGRPYTFDVLASIDSTIFFVPLPLIREQFHAKSERYMYLLAPQLSSLRKIYLYLTNTAHMKAIERLAFRLLDFSQSPWYEDGPSHPIRGLSQDMLATAILSNRQDTNVMLGQLEQQGLIRKSYNQIEILDKPGLMQIARMAR